MKSETEQILIFGGVALAAFYFLRKSSTAHPTAPTANTGVNAIAGLISSIGNAFAGSGTSGSTLSSGGYSAPPLVNYTPLPSSGSDTWNDYPSGTIANDPSTPSWAT